MMEANNLILTVTFQLIQLNMKAVNDNDCVSIIEFEFWAPFIFQHL